MRVAKLEFNAFSFELLQFATVFDHHRLTRVSAGRSYCFDGLDHIHTFYDLPEDNVFAIKVWGIPGANEEL